MKRRSRRSLSCPGHRSQARADCVNLSARGTLEGKMKANWRCHVLAWFLAAAAVDAAAAQTAPYPNKPVQIIADSSAGSTPDVALRFVADRLTQLWGQQVLVVNRPGAGGSLAARAASEA